MMKRFLRRYSIEIIIGAFVLVTVVLLGIYIYQEVTEIKHGEVYSLNFYPAHMETRMTTSVTSNGGTVSTPMQVWVGDQWEVKYRRWDEGNQKFDRGDAMIGEQFFNTLAVGDMVDFRTRGNEQ